MAARALLDEAERAAAEGDLDRIRALHGEAQRERLSEEDRFAWWLLLVEAGFSDLASPLAASLAETSYAARIQAIVGEDRDPEGEEGDPGLLDPALGPARDAQRETGVVDAFLRWFGGRRDLYARQWFDERRRRTGYRPVEEPLTAEVARAHLEGRITVGQYLLFPDATVAYGVIDLDLGSGALADLRTAHGNDVSPLVHDALRSFALRLIEVGGRLGLPLFPEDSAGRGVHLWLFLEPRRPARAVRALLGQVLLGAGAQPSEVSVEIFPKQDRPGQKGLSSLVKLPLGIHQVTLRRSYLLDDALRPIEDSRAALERLRVPAADLVSDVLAHRLVPLPAPELEPAEGPPPLPREESARSLAEAMRAIEPGGPEREACERMLEGCAVLRSIVRKAYEERRLATGEARALLYTVGIVGPSCQLIEEVFAVAQVSKKELDRVRRGLPSPTGCKKLRETAPEAARECRCPSGRDAQPYATPALFAVGPVAPAPPTWKPFAPWIDQEPLETADPLQTIAEWLRRIEDRLGRLEKREG